MPAQPHTAETRLEIDRGAHTIRMARVFDAPRAAIFAAWTQPEQVTCWWDPAGETHMVVEIQCRSAEHLDQFLEMGVQTGTSQTLDNLVAYARGRSIAIDEPA